jgi:5-methyltetrahydropteroyltriglutamate--homocysteine methyltransferase
MPGQASAQPAPVRAHHVGSLLRPPGLRAAFREHAAGAISNDAFTAIQDNAIKEVVALQEGLGLRVVTDGEFRRASYWAHFAEALDGVDVGDARFDFTDEAGDRLAFTTPHVVGQVTRSRPISTHELDFLRSVCAVTPKITMPSPSTMHFWDGDRALAPAGYGSLRELLADLGRAYREEIADLAEHGATFVQLDEVALAMLCDPAVREAVVAAGESPEDLVDAYVEAINAAIRGCPDEVTTAMHVCRGNYKGHWMASGGYEHIAERAFGEIDVDVLLLEFDSPRAGDFAPVRHVTEAQMVVLGLVTSKSPALESRDDLLHRIDAASKHVPVERLALSPQCGFASTAGGNPVTPDDQARKLALIVEIADEVWGSR